MPYFWKDIESGRTGSRCSGKGADRISDDNLLAKWLAADYRLNKEGIRQAKLMLERFWRKYRGREYARPSVDCDFSMGLSKKELYNKTKKQATHIVLNVDDYTGDASELIRGNFQKSDTKWRFKTA